MKYSTLHKNLAFFFLDEETDDVTMKTASPWHVMSLQSGNSFSRTCREGSLGWQNASQQLLYLYSKLYGVTPQGTVTFLP
jgi:hypothetical protein